MRCRANKYVAVVASVYLCVFVWYLPVLCMALGGRKRKRSRERVCQLKVDCCAPGLPLAPPLPRCFQFHSVADV